jgi:DNA-directed RNA polymerase subunit RPC12/RpoP
MILEGNDFMIQFHCENCGQKFNVPQTSAGKKGRCPKCKNIIIVPQSVAPVNPPAPPQEDEPLRLKYESDSPGEQARLVYTTLEQEHTTDKDSKADTSTDAIISPPKQKPATLLNVFTFPFSISGIIHFLIFWLGPFLIGLFPLTSPSSLFLIHTTCVALLFDILLFAYLFHYLSDCVIAAAKDECYAPDISFGDVTTIGDLIRHLLLLFIAAFICISPLIIYGILLDLRYDLVFVVGGTDIVEWLFFGISVFFFPMFLLAVSMFDSVAALNPFLIIGSIASTFLPYCGVFVFFLIIGIIMMRIASIAPGWNIVSWGLDVYLMFIAAYILGRFFRRYEDRLNWEIKL